MKLINLNTDLQSINKIIFNDYELFKKCRIERNKPKGRQGKRKLADPYYRDLFGRTTNKSGSHFAHILRHREEEYL
jgi:hypothetical protein